MDTVVVRIKTREELRINYAEDSNGGFIGVPGAMPGDMARKVCGKYVEVSKWTMDRFGEFYFEEWWITREMYVIPSEDELTNEVFVYKNR